jgi:hypothetical protein
MPPAMRARTSDWLSSVGWGGGAEEECCTRNAAVPPKSVGSAVEDIEVIEGETLTLRCEMSGRPEPELSWTKDGYALAGDVQLLADNATVYVADTTKQHRGTYFCKARNDGGVADKTFNVRVILKPKMLDESVSVRPYLAAFMQITGRHSNRSDRWRIGHIRLSRG